MYKHKEDKNEGEKIHHHHRNLRKIIFETPEYEIWDRSENGEKRYLQDNPIFIEECAFMRVTCIEIMHQCVIDPVDRQGCNTQADKIHRERLLMILPEAFYILPLHLARLEYELSERKRKAFIEVCKKMEYFVPDARYSKPFTTEGLAAGITIFSASFFPA